MIITSFVLVVICFNFKPQQPKVTRKDIWRYKQLVKQFQNSSSQQLYDPKCQITYQCMQHCHVEEASRVHAQAMVRNHILRSIGMTSTEYLADSKAMCQVTADYGLGCVAKDINDRIVGICTAYPLDVVSQAYNPVQRDQRSREINYLWDALDKAWKTVPWHQYADPKQIFYMDDISVLESASGLGIGYLTAEFTNTLALRKGFTHNVGVIMNDIMLQDLEAKNGLTVVHSVDISQITKDGRKIFQDIIDEGTCCRLCLVKLKPSKL